jgi:hypothetical protein
VCEERLEGEVVCKVRGGVGIGRLGGERDEQVAGREVRWGSVGNSV